MFRDSYKPENRLGGRSVRRDRKKDLPPIVRSPALNSLERKTPSSSTRSSGRSVPRQRMGRVSFAAEDAIVRPVTHRKSLSPVRRQASKGIWQLFPGLVPGWRSMLQGTLERPETRLGSAISAEESEKLSALEMQLPRVAGRIDPWLMATIMGLLCVGLVMIYSASSFVSARYFGDPSYYFQKQLLWAFLGTIVMLVTMQIDYRYWRRVSMFGMAIVLPLLVVVLIFGTNAYGATRWIPLGPFFSFQPSELTKLVLALYIADWLARKGNQVETFLYGLAPFILLVGLILGLVLLENDMGTAIIIAGLATAMFFSAGANMVQFLLAMGCGGLVFLTQAFKPYRYARLLGFMDPFKHTTDLNLQLYQSLLALGSGGWFGVGLGASRQKTGYLPLPYIDSIFAIIGEEIGFIGCVLIIALFMLLAFRGFRLARRTQDLYGSLLATGITTGIVLQAMINIGATAAAIPYTGVPLPFISFGGSSLVISMAAMGVLLNISRYIQEPDDPALSKKSITRSFQKMKV